MDEIKKIQDFEWGIRTVSPFPEDKHRENLMQLRRGLHMALVAIDDICISEGYTKKRKAIKH